VDANTRSPEFDDALRTLVSAAGNHNKAARILARSEEQARFYFELGFQLIAMGSDRGILSAGFQAAARTLATLRKGGSS
jgi:2-keto-3-deoxy-L-rhamnonate aldolase RhmA